MLNQNKLNTYLKEITSQVNFKALNHKTILVTGSTGLIGYYLTNALLYLKSHYHLNIKIILLVRDSQKINKYFKTKDIKIVVIKDITSPIKYRGNIDYVVHIAGIAQSKVFVEQPQFTINTNVGGTLNLLNFAVKNHCRSFVYISSLEVYSNHDNDQLVNEKRKVKLNYRTNRDSYPISKRISEVFCLKYYQEEYLSTKVLRFSQVIATPFNKNDNRLSSYLVRCASEGENIILRTPGKSKRNYLYIVDAIKAIFLTLLSKKGGEIYNVASDNTYASINELANCFKKASNYPIKVIIKPNKSNYYLPDSKINLDTTKIKKIGFISSIDNLNQLVKKVVK